jgi:transposase
MARTTRKTDWREQRRFRALDLRMRGWTQMAIAEALGVTQGAVSQWLACAETGGRDALRTRTPPGPSARLSPEQLQQLPALLLKGAEAYGFLGDVWTRQRIADVIARHFGVRLSLPTISRVMQRIGWTHQRPELYAVQRDDTAIEQWKSTRWPVLKKKHGVRGAR